LLAGLITAFSGIIQNGPGNDAENFPIGEKELPAFLDRLADKIMAIHDIEQEAVEALQEIMTGVYSPLRASWPI
jgi:hypothetical protein